MEGNIFLEYCCNYTDFHLILIFEEFRSQALSAKIITHEWEFLPLFFVQKLQFPRNKFPQICPETNNCIIKNPQKYVQLGYLGFFIL